MSVYFCGLRRRRGRSSHAGAEKSSETSAELLCLEKKLGSGATIRGEGNGFHLLV